MNQMGYIVFGKGEWKFGGSEVEGVQYSVT